MQKLRQEDGCNDNEESQRAITPTGAQDSESRGESDEWDPDSEAWEDAEDMEWDEEQRQPEVGDPPLLLSMTRAIIEELPPAPT